MPKRGGAMKYLKNSDIIISLICGCLATLLLAQFQIHKKYIGSIFRDKPKMQNLKLAQNKHDLKNITKKNTKHSALLNSTMLSSKNKRHIANDSSLRQNHSSTISSTQFEEPSIPTTESTPTEDHSEFNELSVKMNRKIENYLVNQLGLSASDTNSIISSKLRMENDIYRNNQSIQHESETDRMQLNIINQDVISNYDNELKHILGLKNYQRYSLWQKEQEAALAESYAGGSQYQMDDDQSMQN